MPETRIKLLIVEDEPITRTTLSQIFTQMGHSVRSAEDGFSALRQIREAVPDVLLSDLNMPGMSGFELLSVVRRRLPEIYVIATSGAYSGETVPQGIAADAFYEKATSFRSLVSLMEAAARTKEKPGRGTSAEAPIWTAQTDDQGSGEAYVMISCPECLRIFAQVFVSTGATVKETCCAFCGTAINYAIVQPLDPATSQPYGRELAVAQTPVRLVSVRELAGSGGFLQHPGKDLVDVRELSIDVESGG